MSALQDLLNNGGDAGLRRGAIQAEAAGSLFSDANWDQVGTNKELTDFLHKSLDPNGSKYGGDVAAMKEDILNTTTARGSSMLASVWDYGKSTIESQQSKRFQNLIGRLYESAPNRLLSGNVNDTYQAVKSGLLGGAIYDAPLLLATGGLSKLAGLGAKGLASAGENMLGKAATEVAATEFGSVARNEAMQQAGTELLRDGTWEGIKRGAIKEGAENAAFGVGGDLAQQGAGMNRESQDSLDYGSLIANAVLGGGIGAVAGGVGGISEGRALGRDLQGRLSDTVRDKDYGKLFDQAGNLPPAAPVQYGIDGVEFDASRDAYNQLRDDLANSRADLETFANRVRSGSATSSYSIDQLDAMHRALSDLSDPSGVAEQYMAKAAALRAAQTPDVAGALKYETLADKFTKFAQVAIRRDDGMGELFAGGDIDRQFADLLSEYNRALADAMGEQAPPAGAKTAAPGAPSAPTSGKAQTAQTAQPPASKATGSTSEPGVVEKTATEQAGEAPPVKEPGDMTAPEVEAMAASKFTDAQKQALIDLKAQGDAAGIDLQTIIDGIKANGATQTAADITKKAREAGATIDRGQVSESIAKVTGAMQEHAVKAETPAADVAPPMAEAVAAEPPPATKADAPAAAPAAETAAVEVDDTLARAEDALEDQAAMAGQMNYVLMTKTLDGQVTAVNAAIDSAVAEIEKALAEGGKGFKMEKGAKASIVRKALDAAVAADPNLAAIIDELDPEKMTSTKGVAAAKAQARKMANDAISFTYAKVIGDLLPDAMNADHYDSVLASVLRGAPAEDVKRISNDYRQFVAEALLARAQAIGVDTLRKDPVLGAAWDRMIRDKGGFQVMDGVNKTTINIGDLVNRHEGYFKAAIGNTTNIAEANAMLNNAAKTVRGFMDALQASGMPMDSDLMRRALEMRALHAVDEEINGVFQKANKEAFDKMDAMRALRERDKSGNFYSRTSNNERNPFARSMVGNPIMHRVEQADGSFADEIVSGRRQTSGPNGTRGLGGPQGILSDGISDYIGLIWSHPRKVFGAVSAARTSIYRAGIDATSASRGSMIIDGVRVSNAYNEVKGRYAEGVNARLERSRSGLIIDALERFTGDELDQRLKRIGEISGREVHQDERYVAQMLIEHRKLRAGDAEATRAALMDIFESDAKMGTTSGQKIIEIVQRANDLFNKNDRNLVEATKGSALRIEQAALGRGKKGVKENKATGTAETKTTKQRTDEAAAAAGQGNSMRPYTMTVTDEGNLTPSITDNTVLSYINIGSKKFEFLPGEHIEMRAGVDGGDGDIYLFGEKIGTWFFDKSTPEAGAAKVLTRPIVSIPKAGIKAEEIGHFSSFATRAMKAHKEDIVSKPQNLAKLKEKAKGVKAKEGDTVSKEASQTGKAEKAIEELKKPVASSGDVLTTKMSAIEVPHDTLPDGRSVPRRLVIKSNKLGGRVETPGATQMDMTVADFAAKFGLKEGEYTVGTLPAGRLKGGKGKVDTSGVPSASTERIAGKGMNEKQVWAQSNFVPLGGEVKAASKEVVEAIIQKNSGVAPILVEAKVRPITLTEAESIEVDHPFMLHLDGTPMKTSLDSLVDLFDKTTIAFQYGRISLKENFDSFLADQEKLAKLIESVAPHGVKRENASRRTSFSYLQSHLAGYTDQEKQLALDMLRRMDASRGQLPYFSALTGNSGDSMTIGTIFPGTKAERKRGAVIELSGKDGYHGMFPKHFAVAHELAHWAFVNVLSPSERIEFMRSLGKYYDADGRFSTKMLWNEGGMKTTGEVERALGTKFKGADATVNELFAWQFTNYYFQRVLGKGEADAQKSLWDKVVTKFKSILEYVLNGNIDKDLIPLFERVLPSTVSETKFEYGVLYDTNTGKAVNPAELTGERKKNAGIHDIMQKIDEHRSRLGQQLFSAGGVIDGGFAEDLKAAASHMFGLLYGADHMSTNAALKGKYNPSATVTALRKKLQSTRMKDGSLNYLDGSVDHRNLFQRGEHGKLVSAIYEIMPDKVADSVSFEAGKMASEAQVQIASSAIGDNPMLMTHYREMFANHFASGLKDVVAGYDPAIAKMLADNIDKVNFKDVASKLNIPLSKFQEILDAADLASRRDVASFAKESNGVDISDSLFDNTGARAKLGNAQQRAAMQVASRDLYDLMSDALDHLETQVNNANLVFKRNERRVAPMPEREISPSTKVDIPPETQAPPSTRIAESVASEEGARNTGNDEGIPDFALDTVKITAAAVPHRDPAQRAIIETMIDRIMSVVLGEDATVLTNADVARITGVKLEDGFVDSAEASDRTAAFKAFRDGMRSASEALTNGNRSPQAAIDIVYEMLANFNKDILNENYPTPVRQDGTRALVSTQNIVDALKKLGKGEELKSDLAKSMSGDLLNILEDASFILAGLGRTASAERAVGPKMATPGKPMRVEVGEAGGLHPTFAAGYTQHKLSSLPQRARVALMDRLGLTGELRDHIGFVADDGRVVYTTVQEMTSVVQSTHPEIADLDASIARAVSSGYEAEVSRLLAKRNAVMKDLGLAEDGVRAVVFNRAKMYDPMSTENFGSNAVEEMVSSGKYKNETEALVAMGYQGRLNGEVAEVFNVGRVYDLEETLATLPDFMRNMDEGDTALTGEIVLNMAIDNSLPTYPMAIRQRATQAGAPAGIANLVSNLFKPNRPENGLSDEAAAQVRTFHGMQLRSNSSRILKDGALWLADRISPVEGTGFYDKLATRMSSTLTPLSSQIDKLAGVDTWYKKVGYEIYRNLDMRRHSIPQSDAEERIVSALRTGDISGLSLEERKAHVAINKHFQSMLEMQRDAGIDVADISDRTNGNYIPQRFNLDWIRANRDDSINMLTEYFKKDRGNGASAVDARTDATRVINEALNREELQGIVDGSSSAYTQAFGDKLHSRKLNLSSGDWAKMAPMFDSNLRSLLTSYTEAAHKRVEWSNTFGVRGHGAATYIDIADRGAAAAIDALMGKADGMKIVPGFRDLDPTMPGAGEGERDVEFVRKLFNPTTNDVNTANRLVAEITNALDVNKNYDARAKLVNDLVERHVANGGFGEEHFRKRAESIVNGLADFGDSGGTVSKNEREFMLKMVGTMGGRPAYTIQANQGLRDAAGAVKMFNSVTLLSTAVVASLADPAMSLMRSGSITAWMKGTTKAVRLAMSDPITADAMMRVGVTMESILNENITHVHGGMAGRISNAFFQANMLTPWTNSMRQAAALVGFESIKSNQMIAKREAFLGNQDSWKYRKSMRYLRELGLADLVNRDNLDTFALAVNDPRGVRGHAEYDKGIADMNQAVAEAVHKFTNESVFQPNRNDMPLWTQDPIAGIFWQFKSYPTMMGRLVKKNFKDAVAFTDTGKYEGDPMGLMYLLTIGAAAGAGSLYAKDKLLGKNQDAGDDKSQWRSARERTLSKMAQEFGFKDFDLGAPGADVVLGTYAQGLLGIGALGFLGDLMYQSAKSVDNGAFGRERIMSQIAGPTLGTFTDSIQLVEGAHDALTSEDGAGSGAAKQRNAVRKVLKRIPGIGAQDPWVETWVDDVAGEANTPPRQ